MARRSPASSTASPGFFNTQGLVITAGREFDGSEDDHRDGLVINRVMAERLWPLQSAVGQPLIVAGESRIVTGVVADDRCHDPLGDPFPCAWRPFPAESSSGYLRVRTRSAPMELVPILRALVHELDPDTAVAQPIRLDAFIANLSGSRRVAALLSMALALMGVALLAAGCVSLFVSIVRRSAREVAIRIALGARDSQLLLPVMTQAAALTSSRHVWGISCIVSIPSIRSRSGP
jgi:putative ABC transport system permease protein